MPILTAPHMQISLENLVDNYKVLRQLCSTVAPEKVGAVIKANGYSLGADMIVEALYHQGCRTFFIAHASEGANLAKNTPQAQFYVLQGIGADTLDIFLQHKNMHPVIASPDMFKFYQPYQEKVATPAIQIETGLNRLGFRQDELQRLSSADLACFGLVLSHLACADEANHFMNTFQLDNFKRLKEAYFKNTPASLSASDGVFLGDEYHFDMVRLGGALYGINTAPYRHNQMKPVVKVAAPVLQIAELKKGDFVGYSATYKANKDKKIAVISIGYGDGVPRSLSNRGTVFFKSNGHIFEAPIIGRVSMDNIMCDISHLDFIDIGDTAYLLSDFYTLDDMARDSGLSSYEILSHLGNTNRMIKTINI